MNPTYPCTAAQDHYKEYYKKKITKIDLYFFKNKLWVYIGKCYYTLNHIFLGFNHKGFVEYKTSRQTKKIATIYKFKWEVINA